MTSSTILPQVMVLTNFFFIHNTFLHKEILIKLQHGPIIKKKTSYIIFTCALQESTTWFTNYLWKIDVLKNADKILIDLCLIVNFTYFVQVLTCCHSPKLSITYYFKVLYHYTVTTLKPTKTSSPGLYITNTHWLKNIGHTRYRGNF